MILPIVTCALTVVGNPMQPDGATFLDSTLLLATTESRGAELEAPSFDAASWLALPSSAEASSSNDAFALEPIAPQVNTVRDGGSSYLRLGAGLVTTEKSSGPDEDIDFDEGYLLSVAFGQRMNHGDGPNFSLELEGVWSDQDADDKGPIVAIQEVSVGALFVNGVFDIPLGERASAYLGAGIGVAWVDVGTTSDNVNDFGDDDGPYLSWQARAGLEWRFSTSTALYVGYRFMNIDDVGIDDNLGAADFDLETQQHVIEAGLKLGL